MRIMLACQAGMSTSLVVMKMRETAKAEGKNHEIWAVDQELIESELGNFDVLLLGPQVRHIMRKVSRIVDDRAPVAVIEPSSYGRCDGAAVLRQAESLYEKKGE